MEIFKRNLEAEAAQSFDLLHPGEWYFSGGPEFDYVVMVQRCPVCMNGMSNMKHEIAADGTCSPSLVCPYADRGCSFHVFGRYDGWDPELGGRRQRCS